MIVLAADEVTLSISEVELSFKLILSLQDGGSIIFRSVIV